VALPMDEQRILEEMERMLAADDPKLAARLAAFGQPGFGQVLRTRRARATLSIMVLVLIAAVAAVIYLMSSFRPGNPGPGHRHSSVQHSATPSSRPVTHRVATAPAVHVSKPTGQQVQHPGPAQCAATVAPACGHWTMPSSEAQPQPSQQAGLP
jgi:Protein of unknown function (DUF3040)